MLYNQRHSQSILAKCLRQRRRRPAVVSLLGASLALVYLISMVKYLQKAEHSSSTLFTLLDFTLSDYSSEIESHMRRTMQRDSTPMNEDGESQRSHPISTQTRQQTPENQQQHQKAPFPNATSSTITPLNILFMGDSVMRYQYLSLVSYLEHGRWPTRDQHPSIVKRADFSSWASFYNYTTHQFPGHEQCDCYRKEGRARLLKMCENRYYYHPVTGHRVSFVQKFGRFPSQGHFTADQHVFRSPQRGVVGPGHNFTYSWSGDWNFTIRHHVARMQPKPAYFVFNSGLWSDHDLTNATFQIIVEALRDVDIVGIYRKTTASQTEREHPHDEIGCAMFPYCQDVAWTFDLNRTEDFWENNHPYANVYQRLNEEFLQLMNRITLADT